MGRTEHRNRRFCCGKAIKLRNNYKNAIKLIGTVGKAAGREDGAALIIVLTIIFVMTALGGVALLATLTNLRMSAKYSGWTAEYYALDSAAEEKVRQLDARLSEAEGYAYEYMRAQHYLSGEDIPVITGDGATDINEKAQNFIYNTWYNSVYAPSFIVVGASSEGAAGGAELIDEQRYNSLFARFSGEFYQRLYYYFAYRLVAGDVKNGAFAGIELSHEMLGYAGMLDNYGHDPNGMTVGIEVTDGEDEYAKHVSVSVRVTAPVYGHETRTEDVPLRANPLWAGALAARGSIIFGAADPAAATGGITRIYGDVSAVDFNEFYIDQNDWAPAEGNAFGVASDGAAVEIYGNVYSRGDLHVTGSGGSITVRRYAAGHSDDYKRGLFGNTLYFDTSAMPVMIQRYTQPDGEAWGRDFVPFFYRDHLGGNIYCNSLSIEDGVYSAFITVENGPIPTGSGTSGGGTSGSGTSGSGLHDSGMPGVVWTFNDVRNSGLDSRITIEGNLIGLSSDAIFNDHTSSSAVINTYYESSTIELMGAIIVPGTAFMQFDEQNDITDDNTLFETAESISASNQAILNAYMEKPSYDPGVLYYYNRFALNTERGISDIFLVHYEAINDKTRHLVNRLSGRIPDTGIVVSGALEGYTRGAVIAGDAFGDKMMFGPPGFGDIEGYREIANYAGNYLAYSEIKDSLEAAYRLKTESFGASGHKFGDLVKLSAILDPSGKLYPNLDGAITFMAGDSVLELDGELSGIVYCAAMMDGSLPRLTIRGDGTFRGVIISEGDIVIDGAPTIYYDEKLISKILLRYPEIRDFFSSGEMGETVYVRIIGVAQGVKKLVKERYMIIDWKQWQE
ncbi:MAG: hypothetical protein FWH01_11080 [Oscillospiraceae bacterium]|nr:hypothetical protein [Oscillospiraceae bacterium]